MTKEQREWLDVAKRINDTEASLNEILYAMLMAAMTKSERTEIGQYGVWK